MISRYCFNSNGNNGNETMTTVTLDRQTLKVNLHFCPSCIGGIKERIPMKCRTWNPQLKVWYVDMSRLDDLLEILRDCTGVDNTVLIDLRLWRDN